ncbi:MAG: SCO family protein [Flavobacteriales bacterium]|nr:SCO family protein [Flavobacteriales bacterium]
MECEGDKTYTVEGSCPVCKMDLKLTSEETIVDDDADLDNSIFNLTSKWNTEEGETIQLTELNGSVLIVVMIYTTCKAACPRLVADMRNIREKVGDSSARYILVSIDPENDTPERLKAFAIENQMDGEEWTFLQGTVDDVREFSNVLAVKYKQISPIDFSHSNIISVFDENGVLKYQQEGLGVDNSVLVSEVKALLSE